MKQKPKRLTILLFILFLFVLALFVGVLVHHSRPKIMIPDYAPIEEDENVDDFDFDIFGIEESSNEEHSVSLSYSTYPIVDKDYSDMELYLSNPRGSSESIVFTVTIKDHVIYESGRIDPGNSVSLIQLDPERISMLQKGEYDGMLHLYYYDLETAERASVDTEIPLKIYVRDNEEGE